MAMHKDNENGPCTFRALSVSDPCLSNTHEIAPFNSHYADGAIDRSTSDAKVLYSREPKKTRDTTIRDTPEPPQPRVLKLVLKEPKKLPPPVDEGTDIDEEYYCYHKYYKGIIPLRDYYTYTPTRPAGESPAQQTTNHGPSSSKTGPYGPQPSASLSARPTDKALLDHVIELSKTDEGTDIDKAYYLYHQYYKGTMPTSDSYPHRPPSPDGNSSSPKANTDAPSASQTGPNRRGPSASSKARPTDMSLLDRVIELSQTDEGTDLDQAYYRYHMCYKGVIPLSDYYTCRLSRTDGNGPLRQTTNYVPAARTGIHDMQPLEQALLSAQVLLNDRDYSA